LRCSFASIASLPPAKRNMFDQILEAAPDTGLNTSFNLQMLFVPQYNDSPEHASFLDFADRFLNRGGATLNTADSAVLLSTQLLTSMAAQM